MPTVSLLYCNLDGQTNGTHRNVQHGVPGHSSLPLPPPLDLVEICTQLAPYSRLNCWSRSLRMQLPYGMNTIFVPVPSPHRVRETFETKETIAR